MKPRWLIVNWTKGSVSGIAGTEEEARSQLKKCVNGTPNDTYLLAEVKVLSELKRVES